MKPQLLSKRSTPLTLWILIFLIFTLNGAAFSSDTFIEWFPAYMGFLLFYAGMGYSIHSSHKWVKWALIPITLYHLFTFIMSIEMLLEFSRVFTAVFSLGILLQVLLILILFVAKGEDPEDEVQHLYI